MYMLNWLGNTCNSQTVCLMPQRSHLYSVFKIIICKAYVLDFPHKIDVAILSAYRKCFSLCRENSEQLWQTGMEDDVTPDGGLQLGVWAGRWHWRLYRRSLGYDVTCYIPIQWLNLDVDVQQSLYFTTLYFKTTIGYKTTQVGPKVPFCVLNDLYFETTCNIRPHFLGPMGGLKIEGLLYKPICLMWQ